MNIAGKDGAELWAQSGYPRPKDGRGAFPRRNAKRIFKYLIRGIANFEQKPNLRRTYSFFLFGFLVIPDS